MLNEDDTDSIPEVTAYPTREAARSAAGLAT
jgi:hypothetical protein